jgi:glycosyltransferase involved in cell wall biosynthesis
MKKYRILVVVRHPVGGIRTFFRYLYNNLSIQNYQFTLVAPEMPEVNVLLEDLRQLDLTYKAADKDVSNGALTKLVTKIVTHQRFDLIHSHGFTAGVCSIAGTLLTGTPHILTCHDVFTDRQFVGPKGIMQKLALGLMLSVINRIHCVSHDARTNLLAYLPILRLVKHKVIAIPNGIETAGFLSAERRDLRAELGLPKSTYLVGFMGRFMSQKGFRYLLDALELIKKEKPAWREPLVLAFGGEDGFSREEKEEVKKRQLTESVLFLPFVPHVASTLKGLDVMVMPSLWEACGLLAMEAMTAGVPLVGTDCVGLREVLEDTPAHVVPAKNSVALAKALLMEMTSPSTARAKEFATQAAARFQVQNQANQIEKLMRKLLKTG